LRHLPLDLIEPNLSQARRYFDEEALQELASSMSEFGLLQPVLVRQGAEGKYGLIAGERRWRAAQIAGLESIPALVSAYDDLAALQAALIENMAREDLNPVEEARACATLVRELGLSLEQIGDRVGRSRAAVSNSMRLLGLSEEILELLERGALSEGHGRALLMAKDGESRRTLASKAVEEGWSVRTLEARAVASGKSRPVRDCTGPVRFQGDRGREDVLQAAAMNIARVWGDAVGSEVEVRILRGRKLRVEFPFFSSEEALAMGELLGEKMARGKRR
jgi:ParB family transcriptional regulator, chromosome partitioning protein